MIDLISTNRKQSEAGKVWVGLDSCPAPATVFLRTLVFGEFYLCSVKSYLEERTVSSVLSALSFKHQFSSVHFISVAQSCPTLCHPTDCSTPGLPVHHQLPEFTKTHVHQVSDTIQLSHPLSSPSPPTFNLSQHQGLFKWVSSLHQVTKVLELQLQHQSFQWTPRTDLL